MPAPNLHHKSRGSSCHTCKQKKDPALIFQCRPQNQFNFNCKLKFCYPCLKNKFNLEKPESSFLTDPCPVCKDLCRCNNCTQRNGKKRRNYNQKPNSRYNEEFFAKNEEFFEKFTDDDDFGFQSNEESDDLKKDTDDFFPCRVDNYSQDILAYNNFLKDIEINEKEVKKEGNEFLGMKYVRERITTKEWEDLDSSDEKENKEIKRVE